MAQRRIAVGGLTAVAIVSALVVAGCGGGGSSASGAASTVASGSAKVKSPGEAGTGGAATKDNAAKKAPAPPSAMPKAASGKAGSKEEKTGSVKKKHPPLALPTGKPEEGPTKAQQAEVPTADLEVAIAGGKLTAANTCNGKDVSPAVEWGEVPSGTAELALFVMNLQPVEGKLYFDWAVAGIDPSSGGLKAGTLPKGSVVGKNSAGQNKYSFCPQGSGTENYVFALYALPKSVSPKAGFEPLALRKEATQLSESVGLFATQY
jgi:phosphatidylethanolamine-binding protein (PEBP) family uncharacterized protein